MGKLFVKNGKYLFFFILLMVTNLSCDEIDSQVPEVPVNFTINLNIYNELQNPGSSVYFEYVGFGGVIVSCHVVGEYYAYDATCTHEISQSCHLEPDGLLAACPCCESQYSLFYSANPISGPASAPLKQYNVSVLGNSTLRVFN
ncbi:Rieske 2Fe-2S domain-containing protein [Prolixibacteraceae bacterium Z1-6]|uniref:Rieske 2Fe-2S domain-containing protein n=1 Tax=Draconibacterium aestuarii TaxID=2998507 RepID=A0A9X3FAG1_9BACT|nr:Rieske 2Fe-2S domain-containing protein [Prolixibacteraceae bacterium Z1-6]